MNDPLANLTGPPLTLIGHPRIPIGRGEHIRTIWRAFRAVGVTAHIYDLYRKSAPADPAFDEFAADIVAKLPAGIRIFHLNGVEIPGAIAELEERQPGVFHSGYNIAFPAWELPRYPLKWARQLERFHEVWAASSFIDRSLRAAISVPVIHLPDACEPHLTQPLPRQHFGLDDSCFLILFFFDLSSYSTRKNPEAAIEAFRRVVAARPSSQVQLVLKINNSARHPGALPKLLDAIGELGDRVKLLDVTMTDNEIKSLVRCCDCFLSLHRSEGFGRGPAEAMFFGKPVVATGWSGNMEYMNPEVSFPVAFDLIPVKEGEYLAWQRQHWAEPRISDAVTALLRLIDQPDTARTVGERARIHMQSNFSDRALGFRYRARIREIEKIAFGGGKTSVLHLATHRLILKKLRYYRKRLEQKLSPATHAD
jgi:glycosyltransferase involved in cell wall biosynthesis